MDAIILSAGLGNRLKPITDFVPKPLLPIIDRPMVDININRLVKNGIKRIGINLFHKAEMIKDFLEKYQDIMYVAIEDKLKGTGGALLNFDKFIRDDFVIYSCDVLSDVNLADVVDFHNSQSPIATLVLLKNEGTNFIKIDKDHRVQEISQASNNDDYTLAGVSIYSNRIFSFLPHEDTFSIVDVLKNVIDKGEKIVGLPQDMIWCNINSHHAYWKIHHDILYRSIEFEDLKVDSKQYIDPTSDVQSAQIDGFVSIGSNCFISDKVSLNNAVVFENSRILEGNFSNCLLSNEFCVRINLKGKKINGI